MGKREVQKRETKKPKKGLKKTPDIVGEFAPPPIVEVVRRKRKEEEEVEE
jgi:hypothetical protein